MGKITVYAEGGFDSSKPNNNIVEEYDFIDEEEVE